MNSMLPAAAVYHLPWELQSRAIAEGTSVRTFGRLTCYLPEESKAFLTSQHGSVKCQVVVHTSYVEPFNPIEGAIYMVLGETENTDDGGAVVRARVLNCVDGVDLALLQKAVQDQRSLFQEYT
ncbi:CST complex subunit TEN1 [Engraulis encrasicolus]|uniref:CST complex subunit TEN1 n=1 Tax=Engraulis encrasicolus TaxID=184585 RepID=UPI002FD44FDB